MKFRGRTDSLPPSFLLRTLLALDELSTGGRIVEFANELTDCRDRVGVKVVDRLGVDRHANSVCRTSTDRKSAACSSKEGAVGGERTDSFRGGRQTGS